MAENWFVSVLVGGALMLFGMLMMLSHHRTWQRRMAHEDEATDLPFYETQYRRRMQVSGLLTLIGLLIAVGDSLLSLPLAQRPLTFAIYWITVLILTIWMAIAAMGDLIATRSRAVVQLAQIEAQRRALEEQARILSKRHQEEQQQGD